MKGKWSPLLAAGVGVLIATVYAGGWATGPTRNPGETDDVSDSKSLTVHEWGTFTSVAGKNGEAVAWLPLESLSNQSDLPCFVNQSQLGIKALLSGTVRMETPVLYFYASRETKVHATVRFSKGSITEWYPQAKLTDNDFLFQPDKDSILEWRDVRVLPSAAPDLPIESGPSHYYAARQTDATPLKVGEQSEKFLFYRGVGNFHVPISSTVESDGRIRVKNTGKDPLPNVILFESRGGRFGYRAAGSLSGEVVLDPPALNGEFASLQQELEKTLVAAGLYAKEAAAMVATWRDSWFEEGTRVFYIVPSKTVDAILPLKIDPKPSTISRAFVGRMEVITPATERAVADAIRTGNQATLNSYARFLRPIAAAMLEKNPSPEVRNQLEGYVRLSDAAQKRILAGAQTCH